MIGKGEKGKPFGLRQQVGKELAAGGCHDSIWESGPKGLLLRSCTKGNNLTEQWPGRR